MEILMELNIYSIILRMTLAMIAGGIIGMERGLRNRPAGFMTYILVSCGSTLIMLTNIYLKTVYHEVDPTRLAAQIVSGIGFLGAGTIITTKKNEIRGLTTAAGLWAAAGVGIAVGCGFYLGAVVGTVFIMLTLVGLRKADAYVRQHAKSMAVYIEYNNRFVTKDLIEFARNRDFYISEVEIGKIKTLQGEYGTILFQLDMKKRENHMEIMQQIKAIKGVVSIRQIV